MLCETQVVKRIMKLLERKNLKIILKSKPIQNENLSKSELVAASALHSGSFLVFTAIKADTGQIYYTALE